MHDVTKIAAWFLSALTNVIGEGRLSGDSGAPRGESSCEVAEGGGGVAGIGQAKWTMGR
jgi:hypothetical protein